MLVTVVTVLPAPAARTRAAYANMIIGRAAGGTAAVKDA